ncbi:interferon-induced very large GTPase 1-like [Heteronotia binoei]|uniref:interferon-induced very large GTPase 1-like n=1 Tax=Heteronotia binoei TaxID=13085 RepID=UPI00292D12DC|nr:interferon-induced very large GTPase 1-like [Heteronotia binoei]
MGKTVRDHLVDALEDLEEKDMKKFKRKLNEIRLQEGFGNIPRGRLQKADVLDLSDLLLSYYTESYAVQVAAQVLESIHLKREAQKLRFVTAIGAKPSSLGEGVAALQSMTDIPSSVLVGDTPCSGEASFGEEPSSRTAAEGFAGWEAMAANNSPSGLIQKARKKLTEGLFQIPPGFLFQTTDSHLLLTRDEYFSLSQMKDPKEQVESLIDLVLRKGDPVHEQFLDCLENLRHLFPTLQPIASYLEDAKELSSLSKGVAETMLAGDIPCSEEMSLGGEASSKTKGPMGSEPISTLEEMKEDSKSKSPGMMEASSSVMNDLDPEQKRRKALQDMLRKLNLEKNQSKKFSLQEVLEISPESLKECIPSTMEDLPWHFLRKVLALNVTARSTSLQKETLGDQRGNKESIFLSIKMGESVSVNPLDVLCAVLLCSDSFLQQEILSKMSMCQFALPLLLPPLETSHCTLMLWAMRDIVKRWRPHSLADIRGFTEESLVLTSMPTISFVRIGSLSFSKSKLLNEFLSPSQHHHDFFMHRDMEGGNIPREIADGLVEIAWYFPGGQRSSDLFPEPVAVANLHGGIESHQAQFRFLSEVSSAVFIFAECISEKEYIFFSSLKELPTKYYFILEYHDRNFSETSHFVTDLALVLELSNSNILVKAAKTNTAKIVEQLRSTIGRIISADPKRVTIDGMAAVARDLSFHVDEDCQECQDARRCALEITEDVYDVALYKRKMLRLQGDLWKNLAIVEKELCRMERQGDMPSKEYRSELVRQWMLLRQQRYECDLTVDLIKFIHGIENSEPAKRYYFLKWMKFNLDQIARANLSKAWAMYKEKCKSLGAEVQKIAEVDQLISSSSLGVEHFMRELGQFYEAEHLMAREGKLSTNRRQFLHFPNIAADLMLEGFPLELIDRDASNIPLKWIAAVLTQLNNKLRSRSKMFVISVLGVQGTGKSTLLNTMFGLQFAVSSDQCTRGAFMTLLKVRENLIQELGCDFILVINTEGLKAPELAKLEDSYQHDNELATLVIGLSDLTIVNMSMGNASEMKDILQIVTHAFLRMERIGQRPNCQFVHLNVSDVSVPGQNMRDRKHLLEQLTKMTQAAAKIEKLDKNIKFSDIMDYDPEIHNWYIPGLWRGVPPMASVNRGYSEKVFELKKYLFEFLRDCFIKKSPKDIPQFIVWMKSLWIAMKHENFSFSFQNILPEEAYCQLFAKYSEWNWGFCREMHLWVLEQKTLIQNASPDELDCWNWQNELQQKLLCGEQQILESLDIYFKTGKANLHLMEKDRADLVKSTNWLKHEFECYSYNKCNDALNIKKGRYKIDTLQMEYLKVIEGKVDRLLEECRKEERRLGDPELRREFERMWTETLSEISPVPLERRHIYSDIEWCLRKDLSHRGSAVNQKLHAAKSLLCYRMDNFQMKSEYINPSFWNRVKSMFSKQERLGKAEGLAKSLMSKCMEYLNEKANSRGDYHETYCGELLHFISQTLQEGEVLKLHTSPSFEVDLKLHILGEAAHFFQKMHEDFIKENDPRVRLEKLKPQYFSTFTDLYLEKDAHQTRAKNFCDQCLHPALLDYVNRKLGIAIVDDILYGTQSVGLSFFLYTVLKEFSEGRNSESYVKYRRSYEELVKSWIMRKILAHYADKQSLRNLEKDILSAIVEKIMERLENLKHKGVQKISEFLEMFCKEMQKEVVISKDSLVGIQFKNMSNPSQFVPCVEKFLPDLQKRILSEFDALELQSKLSKLPVKPHNEIFKQVFGCEKRCSFCKASREAEGSTLKENFAADHQP